MICELCGKEITQLKVGMFNHDGSDSDVAYSFEECDKNAVVLGLDTNWTGYELDESEMSDTIHCPYCGKFPFKNKEIQTYDYVCVVMFKNDTANFSELTKRNILFRGKRKDNGKWVEGDLRQDKDLETCYICGWSYYNDSEGLQREPFEYEVIPETVGQYTRLDDKNGKRIFEKDICKDGLGTLFVIEWDEANARFIGFTIENERRIIYVGKEPRVEIVGNTQDNSELLEVR